VQSSDAVSECDSSEIMLFYEEACFKKKKIFFFFHGRCSTGLNSGLCAYSLHPAYFPLTILE
jgi:hypothetical protein